MQSQVQPKNPKVLNGTVGMIPIRPDMLAFVQFRENILPGEPIAIPGHGAIARYLVTLIEFGKSMYFPGANRIAPENDALTARLKFVAAPGIIDDHFWEYADLIAYYFNDYLYQHWLDSTATFVGAATFYSPRLDSKEVLADFMRQTNMENHREQDADIKAYYRLRLSRNLVVPKRKGIKGGG